MSVTNSKQNNPGLFAGRLIASIQNEIRGYGNGQRNFAGGYRVSA